MCFYHSCRWSLIAARLPGRTSNSVKNYWNTHLRKKVILEDHEKRLKENDPQKILTKSNIFKPRPQRFKKYLPRMNNTKFTKIQPQNDNQSEPSSLEDTSLWERLLDDHGNFDEVITHSLSWSEEELLPDFFSIEELDQNQPNIGDIISDDHWRDYGGVIGTVLKVVAMDLEKQCFNFHFRPLTLLPFTERDCGKEEGEQRSKAVRCGSRSCQTSEMHCSLETWQ
ncbi:hypothetical protein FEM48_Zijuj06G0183900 [Ziziphus jujuba var. spinosa]|uniref:Uncharacterized protein n=1 Tax=Ziziphus jujuba var. spinosa TaxID=714518 RepID=A0A978VAW5_ZIZJJ|nr:hypothetical protein FEM48_Zijuj06G0183900 [Ziziphus jujuba var. spinosa]